MEPAWSPHGATSRTGTLRSAAPACPPCGTPHTIAVGCHRRDGQLVYAGKSFFLPFPHNTCVGTEVTEGNGWIVIVTFLNFFLIKTSDTLVRESSNPWINEVLEDVERSLCRCFLLMWDAAVLLCSQQCCWMQSSSSTPTWVCTSCYITLVSGGLIVLPFSGTMWIYRNQLRFLKWSPKVVGMQSLDAELPCLDCIVPEIISSSRLKLCLPFIYNRGKSIYN